MSAVVKQPSLHAPARLDQLAWYYHRFRAMDGPEVAHRLGEAVKRRLSRFVRSGWSAFDMGDGAVPSLPPRPGALDEIAPRLMDQWREAAEAARRGDVSLLGQTWPAERGAARWHRDPVTGGSWPARTYCFDVSYRRERKLGDVKYVWELNRLQFLQPVAALAAYERDDALAAFCFDEIESWIDVNPPFRGINWASGIELALRIVSLLVIVGLIGAERASPEQRRKVRACLAAHAYWLARYPSRHSSANNHLIAEAGALFLLGTLWPELGFSRRAAEARDVLIAETGRQFHDDGVGAEQSPTYAAFTLEWYLLCAAVATNAGTPFPSSVTRRLGDAGQLLRWITDEGGNVPRIGDDDEGRVLADGPVADGTYVASVLACTSAQLGRPNLAPPRVSPSLRNLYFGLPSPCQSGPKGARTFTNGGYSVLRRRISGRKAMMVMDHGPLGHLTIAAHGHADALALWLHLGDQPVLVDAGTYLYHSGGAWRDRLRGTGLHNTLCLDGQDSSRIAGPFNWSRKATCERLAWTNTKAETSVCARHDGYILSHGVWHERRLTVHAHGFTVHDALIQGEASATVGRRSVEISFLVHPDLDVVTEGDTATIARDGETLLRVTGKGAFALTLVRGSCEPARGWYSDHFGSLKPAPQLVFQPKVAGERQFEITFEIIAPPAPSKRARDEIVESPHARAELVTAHASMAPHD
ncbi:MAG: heparinase II/III domain-containing protein [Methyloceanibacter sp.]|uniref:heparinase II/III domain-containing protein n=1 Tax=Methyloceanibacter sp. TaxID=1965321 RepID=UPI003D6D271B